MHIQDMIFVVNWLNYHFKFILRPKILDPMYKKPY